MFPNEKSKSAALYEQALKVLPGGNSRHTVFFQPYPIYAARGEGARIWDVDGVSRLDFINNYSALIHGHNHPEIVAAIIAQAQKLLAISLPTPNEIDLANIICERLPGVDQVRFTNSGTEGVMMSIKAARAYTGRRLIAKVEGAYHGSDDTASVSTNPNTALWGEELAPVSVPEMGSGPGAAADVILLPMNQTEASRAILRAHSAQLAGVIIDPLVKNLGYEMATPDYLAMLREETSSSGALLIFDEVYSLRLGYGGAQGATGIVPDLSAMGKIIGGGLPVGAVGGREDIMTALFDPRKGKAKLGHGGTYNANPMTMAAGAVAMRLFDRAAFDRLSALGDRLRAGLSEALAITRAEGSVRGATSMVGFFHMPGRGGTYRDTIRSRLAYPEAAVKAEKFFRYMLNNGVLMGAPGFFVLSTALTEGDIDYVLDHAVKALRTL